MIKYFIKLKKKKSSKEAFLINLLLKKNKFVFQNLQFYENLYNKKKK